jgi:hypothetical protein
LLRRSIGPGPLLPELLPLEPLLPELLLVAPLLLPELLLAAPLLPELLPVAPLLLPELAPLLLPEPLLVSPPLLPEPLLPAAAPPLELLPEPFGGGGVVPPPQLTNISPTASGNAIDVASSMRFMKSSASSVVSRGLTVQSRFARERRKDRCFSPALRTFGVSGPQRCSGEGF